MPLETRIPKEITEYREKIVFGLSGRQLVSIAAALAVVGPTALVLWYLLGVNFSVVEYILIIEALPFIAFGFIRFRGMTFEQAARIRLNFRFRQKRLLKQNNLDYLPSLYPLCPVRQNKGVRREIHIWKETRSRRRQCESRSKTSPAHKRRPRFAGKRARKAA